MSPDIMPILRAESVNLVFGSGAQHVQALKDVSLNVLPGRMTILRGRSGSGKTCMINLLGALDAPTSGNIYFKTRNIVKEAESKRDALRRKDYGFIFQSVALMPVMTAYENVDFALRLSGMGLRDRDFRVKECLALVGLEKRMHHHPSELSGGEQQRVAIARAICHRPGIIFADEPTAELDSHMGLVVVKLLRDLVEKEGLTILMTTHDPNMFELADDVYTLDSGVLTESMRVTPLQEAARASV